MASQACYTEHYVSAAHTASSGSSFSFDWLLDGQEHYAIAFVETSYGLNVNTTARLTTTASQAGKTYTVVATSATTDVSATTANKATIACKIADALKVPTYNLYAPDPTKADNAGDATLKDHTYVYELMYNRLDAANSITELSGYLTDNAAVVSEIKTALNLSQATDAVTLTVGDVSTTAPTVGSVLPTQSDNGDSSLVFKWTPANSGQWCSVCVSTNNGDASNDDSQTKPDLASIPYGLSAGYYKSGYTCMDVTAATESTATVTGLTSDTSHYCYHAFCTTNKLIPTCAEVTLTSNGPYSTSNAAVLAVFTMLLALIFN